MVHCFKIYSAPKFQKIHLQFFWVFQLTDRQTDRRTDRRTDRKKYGDRYVTFWTEVCVIDGCCERANGLDWVERLKSCRRWNKSIHIIIILLLFLFSFFSFSSSAAAAAAATTVEAWELDSSSNPYRHVVSSTSFPTYQHPAHPTWSSYFLGT